MVEFIVRESLLTVASLYIHVMISSFGGIIFLFRCRVHTTIYSHLLKQCISNYMQIKLWNVIDYPCPNFNGNSVKLPLNRTLTSNYILQKLWSVIGYPCSSSKQPWLLAEYLDTRPEVHEGLSWCFRFMTLEYIVLVINISLANPWYKPWISVAGPWGC